MEKQKKYFSTGNIADYCEVDINTVKRWIREGMLTGFKTPSGHFKIPRESFADFIKEHGFLYDPDYFGDTSENVDILLIDDDPNHQDLMVFNLNRQFKNITVETAQNGFDGYLKLNQLKPKLILLDLVMPGITGIEFLRIIRAKEKLDSLNIIVISAYLDKKTKKELKGLNVVHTLMKPVDMSALFELCSEFLTHLNSSPS